jgi:hypothetical protein
MAIAGRRRRNCSNHGQTCSGTPQSAYACTRVAISTRKGRANSYQALTDLVQRGLATIAMDREHAGWDRLDWWAAVVGRARAVLFAHLAGMARKGVMPALVQQDALWVVADDPHPFTAVPACSEKTAGNAAGSRLPQAAAANRGCCGLVIPQDEAPALTRPHGMLSTQKWQGYIPG